MALRQQPLAAWQIDVLDDFFAEDGTHRPIGKRQRPGHVDICVRPGVDVHRVALGHAVTAAAEVEDAIVRPRNPTAEVAGSANVPNDSPRPGRVPAQERRRGAA